VSQPNNRLRATGEIQAGGLSAPFSSWLFIYPIFSVFSPIRDWGVMAITGIDHKFDRDKLVATISHATSRLKLETRN
jgi:hypothetical protein